MFWRSVAALVLTGSILTVTSGQAQQVGDVFVIALENHNFTQPPSQTSPQQLFGNPAAPFINSLITPGNPNAAQVSYATNYLNAGNGVHPSEPNYVWSEAGTDFGVHTDADPSSGAGNIFNAPHLTQELNKAGVSWHNYQEDVQYSTSPLVSASGTNGAQNQYNGSDQFNYAVKHNPMAFFPDTGTQNVYQLSHLSTDLANNTVGKYNWITPDQYNDMHTALNGGFTYKGVHYTGDAANIAQGDNFLSILIPEIEASQAYKHNGAIVIWNDESEGGDDVNRALTEIVISPLAKGDAYASSFELNHSSDLKTMEEIFGVPLLNNPIPGSETFAGSNPNGNEVRFANDLSDLFKPGAIPQPVPEPSVTVTMIGTLVMGIILFRRASGTGRRGSHI